MFRTHFSTIVFALPALLLAGCFDVVDPVPPATNTQQPSSESSPSNGNSAPVISGSPSVNAVVGTPWSFTPDAMDPNGDSITFEIENQPSWANFDRTTGRLAGIPLLGQQGDYAAIRISASDGQMSTALPVFTVSVRNVDVNSAPSISGNPVAIAVVGTTYTFRPTASDIDSDPLSFTVSNRPLWTSFNPQTGELNGLPNNEDLGSYENIVISVSDSRQSTALPAFSINVLSPAITNSSPEISGIPDTVVAAGQTYQFRPDASDPNDDNLSFSISNRPAWASFDNTTGALTGTPTVADVASYTNISISVSDGQVSVELPIFTITVQAPVAARPLPNTAPQISGNGSATIGVGQPYLFQPFASDADGDNLTFAIANSPNWASFDASSGALAGTPAVGDEGVYGNILISVSDGQASSSLRGFSINVETPDTNSAPQISGTAPRDATVDRFYAFQPTVSDPDGDDLNFLISNRPGWASFNSATGALTGTPADSDEGTYQNVLISVSDGELSTSLPVFSIVVTRSNSAPQISGTASRSATVGEVYEFQPSASDVDGDSLSFSIANRPAWASFSTLTGALTGIPAASDEGTYRDVSITVTDGQLSASLASFSIVVGNPDTNNAPQISGNPQTTITVGETYRFQPTAADSDDDPLSFSISNQPSWTSFDSASGTLAGTPTDSDVGTHGAIIIVVSDGSESDSLNSFEIEVLALDTNEAPTISGTPITSITVGQAYSFQPNASDPDGDNLSFEVTNLPSWLSFNTDTGRLSGTPAAEDVATFENIQIAVNDGEFSASLNEFSIEVTQVSTGSATLTWTAPTRNTDGSTLTDLAAYKIYYGTSSGNYNSEVRINNPGLTSYVIENLAPDTYYFVSTSINSSEIESDRSNEATMTISQ